MFLSKGTRQKTGTTFIDNKMHLEQQLVKLIVEPAALCVEQRTGKNCFWQSSLCFSAQIISSLIYAMWSIKVEEPLLILPICIALFGVMDHKQVNKIKNRRSAEMATGRNNSQLQRTERVMFLMAFLLLLTLTVGSLIHNHSVKPMSWFSIPLLFGYVGSALLACDPRKFR